MSDSFLRIIPANPAFVPATVAQRAACERLRKALPKSDHVEVRVAEQIEFVDAGENFEEALCPSCESGIDLDWWGEAMSGAAESEFADLGVVLPCCGAKTTLNDVRYEPPQGFARFVLEAQNPNSELSEKIEEDLAATLGCRIRTIWAHY